MVWLRWQGNNVGPDEGDEGCLKQWRGTNKGSGAYCT